MIWGWETVYRNDHGQPDGQVKYSLLCSPDGVYVCDGTANIKNASVMSWFYISLFQYKYHLPAAITIEQKQE